MTTTIGSLDLNAFSDLYNDSNQYFWFESNASATYGAGVHITLSPDTSFIANPSGQNILMNTDGISIRNGLLPMMVLDNNSLNFNIINTLSDTYTNVASFRADGIIIGQNDDTRLYVDNDSVFSTNARGFSTFEINSLPSGTYNNKAEWFEYNNESPFECVFRWNCTSINDNVQCYDNSFNRVVGLNPQPTLSNNTAIFDATQCAQLQSNSVKYILMGYTAVGAFPYFTLGERGAGTIGKYSTCIGETCVASNNDSYAEGLDTKASGVGAHAEGNGANASGGYSHAEGYETKASGTQSHSEGNNSIASGVIAHAEGLETTASGYASHAEGSCTVASNYYSHAQNFQTVAASLYQTALGKYNVEDSADTYAVIIGNGTSDNARSNALTVDWNGSIFAKDTFRYETDWDTSTTPSSSIYKSILEAVDENDDNMAYIGCNYGSDGGIQSVLGLHRNVSGSDIYHTFGLRIDSAGNKYYDADMSTSVNGSTGKLYFYRFGNIVYFSTNGAFRSKSTSISNGTTLTQKVPSGYRPVAYAYIVCSNSAWRLQIQPDGDILFFGTSAWNANMWVSGMWITGDPLP